MSDTLLRKCRIIEKINGCDEKWILESVLILNYLEIQELLAQNTVCVCVYLSGDTVPESSSLR